MQKAISQLPGKERINYLFQKHVTKGVQLTDQHFGWKIGHAQDHIKHFAANSVLPKAEISVLELGTGWYPIVPIALYLNGFNNIHSVDIYAWMNAKSQLAAIDKFFEWHEAGKLQTFLPHIIEARWQKLAKIREERAQATIEGISKTIGLQHHLQDARNTDFEAQRFGLICSNNTFEHIYASVLVDILKEFKRVAAPGGVMSHFVDLTDHFAHFDKTINEYHFLRFSEAEWQRIDNNIQPQNRLRWPDYEAMYKNLGIGFHTEALRYGDAEKLNAVAIHSEFKKYSAQDLAITHGYLVSMM